MGETLRGTLNSTIDRRFPSKKPEKAALVNSRNEDVLAKGRMEIEGIPGGWPAHERAEMVEGQPPGPPTENSSGMKKLFKRKPVATQGTDII